MNRIKEIVEELTKILENLLKDNADRKKNVELSLRKLRIVKAFQKENNELLASTLKTGVTGGDDIDELKNRFTDKYSKIIEILTNRISFCNPITMSENFNLRTACSLLPKMDGTEESLKQLIDTIELYSEMVLETDQQQIIKFVLKTRLLDSAKIRLKEIYKSCQDLIKDMKERLLTIQSSIAINANLQRARQGSLSIAQFGKNIEDLLVKLTLSQSQENKISFETLRPLNEKIALNIFANGLTDINISTIVKARNFNELKDAIRCAEDQEASGAEKVFAFNNQGNKKQTKADQYYRNYNPNRYNGRNNYRNQMNRNNVRHCNLYQDNNNNNSLEFFRGPSEQQE